MQPERVFDTTSDQLRPISGSLAKRSITGVAEIRSIPGRRTTAPSRRRHQQASPGDPEPTVFVLDDNGGVRRALNALITSAGLSVQTYSTPQEFLAAYDPKKPGCLLLDIRLRGANGLDVQDALAERGATLPIIVITAYGTVPTAVRAMKGGALELLQKPFSSEELLRCVHQAIKVDREARQTHAERTVVAARISRLSPREREVLGLLIAGKTTKEVAAALALSARTVEGHRSQIRTKLEVRSVATLVRLLSEIVPSAL